MTTELMPEIDQQKAQAFSQLIVGVMVGGRLSLTISIGHQTGLFETLAGLPPATSAEIADAAGLNERYVREWLDAMVTGRIVEYDPERRNYWLPPEHALSLTRAGGPRNLAVAMRATGYLARQMLAEAGLTVLDVLRIEGDIVNTYYITTRQ
jgi:DNA-binding IclR family transcriptional regulator